MHHARKIMVIFRGKIIGGKTVINKGDVEAFHRWCSMNEGEDFEIREFKPISYSKRKFFEGPVTQYFFYQHDPGVFDNFREAREALKLAANPVLVKMLTGGGVTAPGSTVDKSDKWFAAFLERIHHDVFLANGYEFPDPDDYAEWCNSAPSPYEVYPPLEQMIRNYKNNKTNI